MQMINDTVIDRENRTPPEYTDAQQEKSLNTSDNQNCNIQA